MLVATSITPLRARVHIVDGPQDQIPAPPGVQPGDVLALLVASTGDAADIDVSGGASGWTLQESEHGEGDYLFSGALFTHVAGADTPSTFRIELGWLDYAVVGLLHLRGASAASLVWEIRGGEDAETWLGVDLPGMSEGVAGGVEVRFLAAEGPDDDLRWNRLGLPVQHDAARSAGFERLAGYLGARPLVTDADIPDRTAYTNSIWVWRWQAWTLVVAPANTTPQPPVIPGFAGGRGRALYRYTAHDLMTGAYIDDIYPQNVVYDKRILEPGQFTGVLPIPNRRVAEAVRRVIPKLKTDLTTGPGRVEIRIWRDGYLWGRYWLTGARLVRSRDGKVGIELRGSTLDATWFSVRIRDTREYSGNPVNNIKSLLTHCMSRPGAFSGIEFAPGSAGSPTELLVTKDDGSNYGRAAQEHARLEDGIEYTLNEELLEDGTVTSVWVWGSPKLGTGRRHVFSLSPHGGDIAEYGLDIDALRGGTDWEARGGTPETDATEDREPVYSAVQTTPHRAAGWPRIDRLIDDPSESTSVSRLNRFARYWARAAGGALWVRSVTVFLGKHSTLNMNCLGDYARLLITDVWHEREDGGAGLDVSERIIGISIRPTGRGQGKEEATLILESLEVPGT